MSTQICQLPLAVIHTIRLFLTNREIVETFTLSRQFRLESPSTPFLTSITVRDFSGIRLFLAHRLTISRTVLFHFDVANEWPFESAEMVLIGCSNERKFSEKVKRCTRLLYEWQWNDRD